MALSTVNRQDLTLVRGRRVVISGTVKQNGAVVNITGWAIRFTAKNAYTDVDAAARLDIAGTLATPASGTYTVTIDDSNFSNFPYAELQLAYEITGVDGSSNPYSLAYGTLTVLPNVYRG